MAQFALLLQRAALIVKREKAINVARMMQTLVFAVLLGLIWLQEGGEESGSAVQSTAGVIFFLLINQVGLRGEERGAARGSCCAPVSP